MQKIAFYITKDKTIYLLLLSLVIIDRVLLLIYFNFKYVGSDDMIFWQSATDYMHGIFHEPYFYGQNYNFMLESLFAIPFLQLGIPYNYAFPIGSCIVSLIPFFLFSYILFNKGFVVESLFFLLLPLSLPIEYGILNSVTRGFVSGLFFTSFFIFSLLNPLKKSSFLIAAISLSMGYIFNPNSLIFSVPICIYLFLNNYKRFSFYWINIAAIIPILLIEFFAKEFYVQNPEYNVCSMWNLSFSFNQIIENFKELDNFFAYFTPLLWSMGWLILVIILGVGIFLIKKDWKKGISVILGIAFIIATLGINKVNDHIDAIFLSSTRMFLGIPLLTGLVFLWSKEIFTISERQLKFGIMIIAISSFCIKTSLFSAVIKHHTATTNYGPVAIKKTSDLNCDCSQIDSLAIMHKIDLIVFVSNAKLNVPSLEFYNYGCPLLQKKFPKTLMNIYEKRTWVYLKERETVEKNIMIYGSNVDVNSLKSMRNVAIISTDPNVIIIKDNTLDTESLLELLNIELKRNTY